MNGVLPLTLTLPASEPLQLILLETDHRKLASEIEHLPYADIPSALTLAYRRIHTLNRFAVTTTKRFQTALPFHHAFIRFKDHFRRQLCGRFQYRSTAPEELDLLLSFVQELSFAYKRVIQETLDKGKRPNGFASVIYMAMMYAHYYSLFSYNRGRMLGPGHWQEFHSIFNLACELELQDKRIWDPDKISTSIEELYKRSVLLGLSSPYTLATEDQWNTLDYLQRFAYLVNIYPLPATQFLQEAYSTSPECTTAANIPGAQQLPHPATSIFDFSALLDSLHKQIQELKSGQPVRTVGMLQAGRSQAEQLLSSLFESWSRTSTRNEERRLSNEQIGLVWGLENICTMLDPVHRRYNGQSNRNAGADNRAWSVANDESVNGFCVRFDKNGSIFPDIGQVVALIRQHQGQKILEMGMVKWAAMGRDNTPRCGIQRMRGNARKISIHTGDELAAQRNGLLISRNHKDKLAETKLIAPTGVLEIQHKALIQSSGQTRPSEIRAECILLKTRNVEVFKVEVREA